MGTREKDLRSARLAAHVVDERANAGRDYRKVSRGSISFAANHRLATAKVDDHIAVFDLFDDAVDDIADAVLVFRAAPTLTCFADWAAMRPYSSGGSASAI